MVSDKKIKILYNDVNSNIYKNSKYKGQGGPARFANIFKSFFVKKKEIQLIPFLFSRGEGRVKTKVLNNKHKKCFCGEVLYDTKNISDLHKKEVSREDYIKELDFLIIPILNFMKEIKPDLVFLNGFSLSNWILLYVAHKLKIPIIIQHAGIWKKEVSVSQKYFNESIRKIFYSFERDTVLWASHHIFLNEFSKNVFLNLHKSKKTKQKIKEHSSVIPLPIDFKKNQNKKTTRKNKVIAIGSVARWDGIKNHKAIFRLANSKHKPKNWSVNVVTHIPDTSIGLDFKQKYKQAINVMAPMKNSDLKNKFYKKMDIILLPSKFDVSPTVVAESFFSGVPVIISDQVGWVSEYQKNNLSSHIIKTGSSGKEIVDIIKRTLSDKEKNVKHYKKFVKYLFSEHDSQKVFSEYFKLFKKYSNLK